MLLGGRGAALDATVPAVAFVLVWLVSGHSLGWGTAGALAAGAAVATLRRRRGDRPLAALLGLLGVSVAALVALYTGRAADFFLAQLLSRCAGPDPSPRVTLGVVGTIPTVRATAVPPNMLSC